MGTVGSNRDPVRVSKTSLLAKRAFSPRLFAITPRLIGEFLPGVSFLYCETRHEIQSIGKRAIASVVACGDESRPIRKRCTDQAAAQL